LWKWAIGFGLFVALAGSAYAAAGGGNPFVASNGTITGCVPAEGGSLALIKPGQKCPTGRVTVVFNTKGQRGPSGSGPAYSAVRGAGPSGVTSTGSFANPVFTTIATLANLPAGSYAILAKTSLNDGNGNSAVCRLTAGSSTDLTQGETHSGYDAGEELSTQLLAILKAPGKAVFGCYVEPGSSTWGATNTSIIATRMTSIKVTPVIG
jgi:hypothetical protein